MGEFELIRRYFQPLADGTGQDQLLLGPGDDCAIQRVSPGLDLVFSVDTLVEGVHFPSDYSPDYLGWRALAVAVSDLAAMGASPVCFTLALTLPDANQGWLKPFSAGLARASKAFGIALAGGDTTRGPLTISIQVHGTVESGRALYRSGAKPGDLICVSGTLGAAGAALDYLAAAAPSPDQLALLSRYHFPEPRLSLGQQLAGRASSAIDISDGLLADLGHILDASGAGARIDTGRIPMMAELVALKGENARNLALGAGDDYELCITIPPETFGTLDASVACELTVIGEITSEPGLQLSGPVSGVIQGYEHFGRPA
ncbi:thiamine-phosphate kinase [Marinobacter nauticus]|jgi:thiamine-monophosphate kinase|uniref:thiamine-phosphate kinase n=1 Tax=Marinobacter nauticus TaxID=2743 RepID=UPI001D18EC39|nr:thiamine-phosphate kinase [Marinobacter nauticus]MCC4272693.1 thiamine-phosphate kinase [Marinobacter nauticus]